MSDDRVAMAPGPEEILAGLREIAAFKGALPGTSGRFGMPQSVNNTCALAADLIEGAEGEIVRLRRALTDISEGYPHNHGDTLGDPNVCPACFAADVLEAVDA